MMGRANISVGICIATFRRPQGLKRILNSIAKLEFAECRNFEVAVFVVENDSTRASEPVVESCRDLLRWPLYYGIESSRGYSHVRNRLVEMATAEGMDYIAFIDDDEVAEPQWLDELLKYAQQTRAEVVLGPVLSHFEEPVPSWLAAAFDRRRHENGHQVGARDFRTGNVLLRTDILRNVDGPFCHAFALTGGEDSHLGRTLERSGTKFVWADDAIVIESVPQSRANMSWVLKKSYQTAKTLVRSKSAEASSPLVSLSIAAKTVAVIALGELQIAAFPLTGREGAFQGICNIAWGFGNLSGLLSRGVVAPSGARTARG